MENSGTYTTLISKLDEFIRKYYKNQLIRGMLYTVAIVVSGYLAISLLEYFGHFPPIGRTVLFWSFISAAAYVLGKFIVLPLSRINRIGKIISHEQAAEIIGKHFTNVQDKLLNVLQLHKNGSGTGASRDLVEASINQRIAELRPVPFTAAIDLKQNRRYIKWALLPLLAIIVIVFTNASLLTESADRLVNHSTYFEEEAPFAFNIEGELEAVENEDFTLDIKLTGEEIPATVTLLVDGNEYTMTKENTIDFNYVFRNVQSEKSFRFSADGFTSKEYVLKVLPNPIILNFDAELKYPAYTGKKNETVRNTGDLVVPAGTTINWKFATRSTKEFTMNFADSMYNLHQDAADKFSFTKRVMESERYSLHTSNDFLRGKDSIDYTISVIPDLYPAISVEEQADSVSKLRLYFTGEVKDDYGFSKLVFSWRPLNKKDSLGNDVAMQTQSVNLGVRSNLVRDQFYYYWDLSQLGVQTGDEIEYYFEVWDNDGVHGAKSTRSQRMVYKAPTNKDLQNMNDSANAEIEKELEAAIEESKMLQEDIDKLHQQIVEKKNVGWEERQKLDALKQKQAALQQRIDQLKARNAQNVQQQQEFQNDPSQEQKQEEMNNLFDQLSTEQMERMIKQMEELMKNPEKDKTQKTLEQAKQEQTDTEKDLDRTLSLFREMQFRDKLDQAIKQLDTLQKQQDSLSSLADDKNLSKQEKQDIQKQQDSLSKQFNELRTQLDKLDSMNQKLENPHEMPNTDLQEMEIQKEQRDAQQEMQDGDMKGGSESQKNASEQMKQLSENLKKAQSDMDAEENAEDVQTIRTLLDNLIQLSFDQEALLMKVQSTSTSDPQYPSLAREQNRLRDNARMIEDSLLALTKRNPQISPLVNKEITNINFNMDRTIRALADRDGGEAQNGQRRTMTSINTLALMLNESLENMMMQMNPKNNQGNPKDCKGGNCKKPGSGKPGQSGKNKPGMKGIRQQQQGLNKRMQDAHQKGQNGQGGASAEELAKMAAEQEALRRMMQESLKDTENDGGGTPGGETAEKMEETETDLVNKNITAETLQRQQEILDKMLEFEKAEQQREQDEQRQANEAKDYELSNPNGFSEYNRQKQQEAELLRTVPPALTPYYKNKVNLYFSGVE